MISKEIGKQRELHCQRCKHEWEYWGQNPYFTFCPRCRTTVRIRKRESRDVVQSVQVDAYIQTDMDNPAGTLVRFDTEGIACLSSWLTRTEERTSRIVDECSKNMLVTTLRNALNEKVREGLKHG